MRLVIWILALFALAVAVALLLHFNADHGGLRCTAIHVQYTQRHNLDDTHARSLQQWPEQLVRLTRKNLQCQIRKPIQ